MHVVVTAGGTREPIDDVRVLTNLSTGRLGAELANWWSRQPGTEVTLLAGEALAQRSEWVNDSVRVLRFGSAADLHRLLESTLRTSPAQVVFMAAAVADYSPVPFVGKLRSDDAVIDLKLKRNPKLLDLLRRWSGPDAVLCGFKLLSGVSQESLLEAARRQIERADTDLCVANDLRELGDGRHPAWIVSRQGDATRVDGSKRDLAAAVAAHIMDAMSSGA